MFICLEACPGPATSGGELPATIKEIQGVVAGLSEVVKGLCTYQCQAGGGRRGIGRDFDIFKKIAVKFPTPGQKCEVKYH